MKHLPAFIWWVSYSPNVCDEWLQWKWHNPTPMHGADLFKQIAKLREITGE